ncbi:MAG TPA: TetR/AcrR family transcriptional regulator [Solirubrobacteraceae bacterium]|nr:TetR/AcrR family transcriptional regulator [Solirubrobacteraceae bacterium]
MSTRIRFQPEAARAGLQPIELMPPTDRKSTQRERLLSAIIAVTNRRGYAAATVSAVIAEAGVSRPTFYDYFVDRDDCFRQAIEDVQQELLATIEDALEQLPSSECGASAIRALLSYAEARPARARYLMGESMTGGPGALDARDRAIAEVAAAIERSQAGAQGDDLLPDLESRVLVGTVVRMIATRPRRGEAGVLKLADELSGWLSSFARPSSAQRWQTLSPVPVGPRSPHVPELPLQRMPGVLPPGRPRLSEQEIGENHRLRILYATARMAELKGYTATTVAEITRLASVDGRVFYRHFTDKQEAFAAVHEIGFQQVMDATAKAFFSAEGWPQRSWEAARALTGLLQANPLVAHVGFVEAYAVGQATVQRIEDSHTAFMFFLQEGLVHTAPGETPSRVAMEAIIASVFEVIYLQTRRGGELQIAGMLPHVAHLWLTPFLGVDETDDFIDRQLALVLDR